MNEERESGSSSSSVAGPSSPFRASPPTSPGIQQDPPSSPCVQRHPPTSPLQYMSSSSSDSSPLPKRRRSSSNPHRTTLQRRKQRVVCSQSSSSNDSLEVRAVDNIAEQDLFENLGEIGDNSRTISDDSSSESDVQQANDSDSDHANNSDSDSSDNRSHSSEEDNSSLRSMSTDNEGDDDSNPCLYGGSDVTKYKANFDVLHLYVKHKWTKASLNSNLKLIKSLLPSPNEMPSSSSEILEWLETLTCVGKEKEFYYCTSCNSSLDNLTDTCECGCDISDVFYSFSLEDQVKHLFENRDLARIIDYYSVHHDRKEGHICDIVDGTNYGNIKSKLTGKYDLILLWNTDGVSLSKSSKQELWPILCTICEVPPRLRTSFIIVCGIFVGSKKPNMNVFLKPFVDSLNQIFHEGGVSWVHPISKVSYKSMVAAPALCADAPAKAMVLNMNYFSGRFGCNVCEQKAKKVDPDPDEVNPKKRKRRRRFVFQEEAARLRTGQRMDGQGQLAELRGKSRKGVCGPAVVSQIPFLDRAECLCADYLHILLQGVVKYFFTLIFNVKGAWYLGDKVSEMDLFLETIKVPDFIKRLVRSIVELKFFKGSEFRAFLLYYSLPVFKYLGWPEEYIQHWILLVASSYILLKDSISLTELETAVVMLRCFVRSVNDLYSDRYYTYNLHNLLHLPMLVKRWGPLWATSAFPFESYNGYISSNIHGTKDHGKALLNTIKSMQGVSILKNIVHAGPRVFSREPNVQSILLVGKCLPNTVLSVHEEAILSQEGLHSSSLYSRGKVGLNLFSTKLYDENKKRANSYVKFLSSDNVAKYGQVLYYIKSDDGVYCLVKVYKVNHTNIFFHFESRAQIRNIIPVQNDEQLSIVAFDKIMMRIIKVSDYFCIPPNTYEINL